MKNYRKTIQLTALLVITFFGNIAYSPLTWAQLITSSSSSINEEIGSSISPSPQPKTINFTPPPPPPDRSAAGERGGAASRGCGNGKQSLIALVPDYKQTINLERGEEIPVTKIWGLTTDAHPTFWFFVPYDQSSMTTIEFVLKDESQKPSKTIYRTLLNKPEMPGIISVSMDKTTDPLQVSKTTHQKNYHWFLKIKVKCNPLQPAKLQTVDGWVERVSPSSTLAERLQQATPSQQVALYAENGIWHNALTTLAELRLAKPKDAPILADWTSLLKSEELDSLANYPVVNCCQQKAEAQKL